MTGHISDSDSLTDIYGKVQALSIKKPEEDDVTILVSMRNCNNSRTRSASHWSAHRVHRFLRQGSSPARPVVLTIFDLGLNILS